MSKVDRHSLILQIVEDAAVSSQAQLVAQLREAGHSVTQASVSRDLEELGVTKDQGIYSRHVSATNDLGKVTFDTAGGCLIVGRCLSGLASAVTVRIDAASIRNIVGTIAGDDTIFIAVKEGRSQAAVLQSLKRLFG